MSEQYAHAEVPGKAKTVDKATPKSNIDPTFDQPDGTNAMATQAVDLVKTSLTDGMLVFDHGSHGKADQFPLGNITSAFFRPSRTGGPKLDLLVFVQDTPGVRTYKATYVGTVDPESETVKSTKVLFKNLGISYRDYKP